MRATRPRRGDPAAMSLLLPISAPTIPRFTGTLIGPDDDGYDAARRVYNGMVDRRPALIARCESVADVAAALAYARGRGPGGGGAGRRRTRRPGFAHHRRRPGHRPQPAEGDPRRPGAPRSPGSSPACCGASSTPPRRSTASPSPAAACRSTGVAGFTLGSGSGWLERKMGLAADNLRAARVLTADGHVVTASETENADLFWALRGGGGNFGIVVEFEFALRPVGPIVLGGMLLWPRERAARGDARLPRPDGRRARRAVRRPRADERAAAPDGPGRAAGAARGRRAGALRRRRPSAAPSTSRRCARSARRSTPSSRCPTARCSR